MMARKSNRERMVEVYERTLKNCAYFVKMGYEKRLLNEIGVLRGVAYCLKDTGNFNLVDARFVDMIEMQNRLIKKGELL